MNNRKMRKRRNDDGRRERKGRKEGGKEGVVVLDKIKGEENDNLKRR